MGGGGGGLVTASLKVGALEKLLVLGWGWEEVAACVRPPPPHLHTHHCRGQYSPGGGGVWMCKYMMSYVL